ncbi:MAG TPA: sulfur carrier protein ThiS [Longimicrobiales bacterium]|nr:sulfur carrier protein ThiS [Longimicrobiales bacterium]
MSAPGGGEVAVRVNGEDRRIAAGQTVKQYVESLGLHPGLVVVEHNREILDRERYGDVGIREGDVLELVHFVGGG